MSMWKILMVAIAIACLVGAGGLIYFEGEEKVFKAYVNIEGKNESFCIYKRGNLSASAGFIEGYIASICSRFNATYNLTKDISRYVVKYVFDVNVTEDKINEFVNLLMQVENYGYEIESIKSKKERKEIQLSFLWDNNIFNFSKAVNEQGKVMNDTTIMHNLTLMNKENTDYCLTFSISFNSDNLALNWKYFNISINNDTLFGRLNFNKFVKQNVSVYISGNTTKTITMKVTFFECPTVTWEDNVKFLCYIVVIYRTDIVTKIPFWIYT